MEALFIKILNMSISASWVVLGIFILRPLIVKLPKYIRVALWSVAGLRLIVPVSVKSILSLIPSVQTVPGDIMYSQNPQIHSGVGALNSTLNPIISESLAPNVTYSANPMQVIISAGTIIWVAGIVIMLIYALTSYLIIKIKVREAAPYYDTVMLCDRIASPFILGIIKPKIYLPSDISQKEAEYVTAHEKAHLKRLDHVIKPIGFLLLTVYWFNPVLWLAYVFLCKDIELACDERVIKELGTDIKKPYSNALINLSVPKRFISACPLAFGEGAVKGRIKSVLSYKKPTLWIIIAGAVCCILAAVCFLTDPVDKSNDFGINVIDFGSQYDGVSLRIENASLAEDDPYIEMTLINNADTPISYGEPFNLFKDGKNLTKDSVWHMTLRTQKEKSKEALIVPLSLYEITDGKYRFEKYFSVGRSEKQYMVYIEFEINKAFFSGKTYYTSDMVYDNGSFSSELYTKDNLPVFYISDTDMTLRNIDGSVCGKLSAAVLSSQNFDLKFTNEKWQYGYSAKSIRENCQSAFFTKSEDGNVYYLLKQKSGEIYVAVGHSTPAVIRYLFKMSESPVQSAEGIKISYYYHSSPEPFSAPTLTIDPLNKSFSFTWSLFSSYMAHGSYRETDTGYELTTDDNMYVYYFNKDGKKLVFDGKNSSAIPKYKYSEKDTEAKTPVPDGAVFETSPHPYALASYDTMTADITGDGKDEKLWLGPGYTSGLFTLLLNIQSEDKTLYNDLVYCDFMDNIRFESAAKDEIVIAGEDESGKECTLTLNFENGNMVAIK